MASMVEASRAALREPLRGITNDGVLRPGLTKLATPVGAGGNHPLLADAAKRVVEAAQNFVQLLTHDERRQLVFPLDADEKRLWLNVHPNVMRHGLMLEALTVPQRDAAMGLMAACLSERGFQQARDVMRVNGMLVDLTGKPDEFGEWPYWVSFFGEPSPDQPWAWQIDGHHLNVNVFVLGDQMVLTPSFMGSEPCRIDSGPLAGLDLFHPEQHAGVQFMRSLNDGQLAKAVRFDSILNGTLPPELTHIIDGRMQAGAFKDNAVLPYEGLRGDALGDEQRRLLRHLIGTYVGWGHEHHSAPRMHEIDAHIDETYFSWMGRIGDDGPFYYRVQSPLVLIEFDHHPGIVFDNLEPSHHHIHTIIRTPNAGDYGIDLLRQHHDEFDHRHGDHE